MPKRKKPKMSKVVVGGNTWDVVPVSKSILAKSSKPIKDAPEPDFSEIKHLLSNKPLEWNPHRRLQQE